VSQPKYNNGITELMFAASRGDLARVEALLGEGSDANANARDAFGQTALMYAASAGHSPVVEELIDAGADTEARNRNNKSGSELAEEKGHSAVAALVRNARLFLAARDGHLAKLNGLLDSGVDPNALLRDGWSALMVATLNNHGAVVAALLRGGARPEAQNAAGWTALMIAERKGHAEVARLLKSAGVLRTLPAHASPARSKEGADDFPEHPERAGG
jgi:serine/threonine-protein phosphatase 6 regulatory ankyrin repeat subunit B